MSAIPRPNQNCIDEVNCRTKGCSRNHPNRNDCPFGSGCYRSDCYNNHKVMICYFNETSTCKKPPGACPYRHIKPKPAAAGATPSTPARAQAPPPQNQQQIPNHSKANVKPIAGPSVPRPSTSTPNKAENIAIACHTQLIRNERRKIAFFVASPEFDTGNDTTMKTLAAYRARIMELEAQLGVFQAVKERTKRLTPDNNELKYQMKREIYRLRSGLPALSKRTEIETHIEGGSSRFLIVQGETGSGKSTQVVQYLADHPRFKGKRIVCTQPRKIAAVSLANRVTFEYSAGNEGAKVGFQVGYHVGGQKRCVKPKYCRIEFVTEGIMLERIIGGSRDPFDGVGAIVVDEAHERSIICDLLLGCFRLGDPRWADIMIVVTSATIDLQAFSQYFNSAPTVEIAGRTFPVDVKYCPLPEDNGGEPANLHAAVVSCAVNIHKTLGQTPGDILCFLPGQDDVIRAKDAFDAAIGRLKSREKLLVASVLTLYGKQDPEDQAQAFARLPVGQRKVIFSTDIAETSVTIDGIVYVIDSGVRKEMTFDPKRNISSLKVNQISRGSAIQRAGRAGRTQPGVCYRLYSADDYDKMEPNAAPEIFRRPLPLAILTLKELQIDSAQFRWISAPNSEAIAAAEQELVWLGALTPQGRVTPLGKLVIESQEEPKLVRMIYRGCEQGFGEAAATLAATFSVANLFFWPGNTGETKAEAREARKALCDPEGDFVTIYRLYKQWLGILEGESEEEPREEAPLQAPANEDGEELVEELQFDLSGLVVPSNYLWGGGGEDGLEHIEPDTESVVAQDEDTSETQSNAPTEMSGLSEVSSMHEDIDEIDAELVRERKRKGKKRANAWCRRHFINGKAVALIKTRAKELEAVFKKTATWDGNQDREPTPNEINRLICNGFYLNCARLFQSKSRARQYFAIFSETIGNLDFKSALLQTETSNRAECKGEGQDWIIYDKILQTSLVLFPMATPIQLEWLEEEMRQVCPDLYAICLTKSADLPTERVVKPASAACLRAICGKYFCNLPVLEKQLSFAVQIDFAEQRIQVFCSEAKKHEIEQVLTEKLAGAIRVFELDTIEVEYGAGQGTRALVGHGHEVKEILFPGEYATLHIRKLPCTCTDEEMVEFLRRTGIPGVISVTMSTYQTASAVAIKFQGKESAKVAHERLRGELFQGKIIEIAQPQTATAGAAASRNVRLRQSCQLNVSWATGISTGRGMLTFRTPMDANYVIENVSTLFPGARVTRVHGEKHPTLTTDAAKTPRLLQQLPLIFDTAQPLPYDQMQFGFTIVDLSRSLDEFEIRQLLARVRIVPSRVTVTRDAPSTGEAAENIVIQRLEFLGPLQPYITEDTVTTDFFQKNHRAGVRVLIPDSHHARQAYGATVKKYEDMKAFNGQPVRLELECTHWTSIRADLHKFFQIDIERVKTYARAHGVTTSDNGNGSKRPADAGASPFVSLWFRSGDEQLLAQIQVQLQQALACRPFVHRNRDLLFTWTGKNLMEGISDEMSFIEWDTRTRAIVIYGQEGAQEAVEQQLVALVERLQGFENIDRLLVLHINKQTDLKKLNKQITSICKNRGPFHWHLVKNRLYVTGSQETCDYIEADLQNAKLLRQKRARTAAQTSQSDCGICFCPLDRNFQSTSVCGHNFCSECIQPMFETMPPPPQPVGCPECGTTLAVQDVVKFASADALRTILDYAVNDYMNSHKDMVTFCPKPGCNQLLPSSGSVDLHCSACQVTYCTECSKKAGKPMKIHPGESCAENQRGLSIVVLGHLKHIRENVLNHKCPRCQTVVYDFTGCCAVTCDKCKCSFCGICFQDCGNDAHGHVAQCTQNPTQGALFLSQTQLKQVYNTRRERELVRYMASLGTGDVRDDVRKYLSPDLVHLDITPEKIFGFGA